MKAKLLAFGLVAIISMLVGACKNPGAETLSPVETEVDPQLIAVQAVSDLALGSNRFSFGLLGSDGSPIENATVEVGFYFIEDGEAKLQATAQAHYKQISADVPHHHEGGVVHLHEDIQSIYVIPEITLDKTGAWAAAIQAALPNPDSLQTAWIRFKVADRSATPSIGEPVPASSIRTVISEENLESLCSRFPPDDMHQVSVDQALARGRPFVVVFATPAFCQSRLCGPVTDLVLSLEDRYRSRVDFIHIEPYDLGLLREEGRFELIPAMKEWGLPSEPWVFVVDTHGQLAAKFEGPFGLDELDQAISRVSQ